MLAKHTPSEQIPMTDMTQDTQRQGAAYNPLTHLVLAPLLGGSLLLAIYLTVFHRADNPVLYPWMIVLSLACFLLNVQSRVYALRVQDRVIRLEERLRLATLLPREELLEVGSLNRAQLIGLRFASDAELPALATRAAKENLSQGAIKDAVQVWRPDNARI